MGFMGFVKKKKVEEKPKSKTPTIKYKVRYIFKNGGVLETPRLSKKEAIECIDNFQRSDSEWYRTNNGMLLRDNLECVYFKEEK